MQRVEGSLGVALAITLMAAVLLAVPGSARPMERGSGDPLAPPDGVNGVLADDAIYVSGPEGPTDPVELSVTASRLTDGMVDGVAVARSDVFADSMASGHLQDGRPLLLVDPLLGVEQRTVEEITRRGATSVTLLGGEAALPMEIAQTFTDAGFSVERVAGASRLETATAIAEAQPTAGGTVLLTRAFSAPSASDPTQAYADSLAVGAFAARFGMPVLMTEADRLSTPVVALLDATPDITEVIIVGGTAAVGQPVEDAVAARGLSVRRIAGGSRFETALALATEWRSRNRDDVGGVTVVRGEGGNAWPAGFVLAETAARLDAPVVLSRSRLDAPGVADQGSFAGEDDIEDIEDDLTRGFLEWAGQNTESDDTVVVGADHEVGESARKGLGKRPRWEVTLNPLPGSLVTQGQRLTVTTEASEGTISSPTCLDQPQVSLGTAATFRSDDSQSCIVVVTLPEGDGRVATTVRAQYALVDDTGSLTTAGEVILPEVSADGRTLVARRGSDGRGPVVAGHLPGGAIPGSEADIDVYPPTISDDGRYALFTSETGGLDAERPIEDTLHLYRRDLLSATTRLALLDAAGLPVLPDFPPVAGRGINQTIAVSADGDRVAAVGIGTPGRGLPRATYIWVQEVSTGRTWTVPGPDETPLQVSRGTIGLDLSADGRWLAFTSELDGLVPDDDNGADDAFLIEVFDDDIQRVSVGPLGEETGLGNTLDNVRLTADGSSVMFTSNAALTEEAGNGLTNVFLVGRVGGSYAVVDRDADDRVLGTSRVPGAALSADGTFVAFASTRPFQPNGVPGCGVYRVRPSQIPEPLTFLLGQPCDVIDRLSVSDTGTVVFGSRTSSDGRPQTGIYVGVAQ